jgi:hypothetical protein
VCTAQPATACDPSKERVALSATGNLAIADIAGPCAGNSIALVIRLPDRYFDKFLYSVVTNSFAASSGVRQIIAADVPACQWQATVSDPLTSSNFLYSGGRGWCTDDAVTVTEQCPHQFVLTLSNGADAVLPTPFEITTSQLNDDTQAIFRQVNPGQSVTIASGTATIVTAWVWNTFVGESTWQMPRGGRCSELPPAGPPGSSPVTITKN